MGDVEPVAAPTGSHRVSPFAQNLYSKTPLFQRKPFIQPPQAIVLSSLTVVAIVSIVGAVLLVVGTIITVITIAIAIVTRQSSNNLPFINDRITPLNFAIFCPHFGFSDAMVWWGYGGGIRTPHHL